LTHGYAVKQIDVQHRARKFGESRGLPPASFLNECVKALGGLLELRREIRQATRQPTARLEIRARSVSDG
jgi:hypothetical protein